MAELAVNNKVYSATKVFFMENLYKRVENGGRH